MQRDNEAAGATKVAAVKAQHVQSCFAGYAADWDATEDALTLTAFGDVLCEREAISYRVVCITNVM